MLYHRITVEPDGAISQSGVDFGQSSPHVLGWDHRRKVVVVHFGGTKFWAGRGESKYAGANFEVLRYESATVEGDRLILHDLSLLVEFSSVRKTALKKIAARLLWARDAGGDHV